MLRELCMPFKVMIIEGRDAFPKILSAGAQLPLLIDEEKIFEWPADVINHLIELEKFKNEWYKFQSDVCYCDDDRNVE